MRYVLNNFDTVIVIEEFDLNKKRNKYL